jgi:hypothetical protein
VHHAAPGPFAPFAGDFAAAFAGDFPRAFAGDAAFAFAAGAGAGAAPFRPMGGLYVRAARFAAAAEPLQPETAIGTARRRACVQHPSRCSPRLRSRGSAGAAINTAILASRISLLNQRLSQRSINSIKLKMRTRRHPAEASSQALSHLASASAGPGCGLPGYVEKPGSLVCAASEPLEKLLCCSAAALKKLLPHILKAVLKLAG